MTKWLNAFLEFKNEAEGTKRFALAAIAVITLSLAMLSICGAWALSQGVWLAFIPRFFYAFLVFGLEMLAAVLFVRALVAAHWMQATVCCVMLLFLAWANVQNAKDGVHFIFPTRFAETGQTLRDRADLANTRADEDSKDKPAELTRIREERAKLEIEQQEMLAQTKTGIIRAQTRLKASGAYIGPIDGIRANLTEEAMELRGEQITARLRELTVQEDALTGKAAPPVGEDAGDGAAVVAPLAPKDQRDLKIEFDAAAREADASAWRLEIILWVAEIARSLGLWAAVASIRLGSNATSLRRREELDEEAHLNALAELRAKRAKEPASEPSPAPTPEPIAAELPEPVETVSQPRPPPPPPDPEVEQDDHWRRKGGKNSQHMRKAAKEEHLLIVGDWRERDAEAEAARMAAQ